MYEAAPAALAIPGVEKVEAWVTAIVFRNVPDDSRGRENIAVFGVPPESAFVRPTLLAGRWLRPDDKQALVINIFTQKKNPDLDVGSNVELKINGRKTTWQIVGIVTSQLNGFAEVRPALQFAYANRASLALNAPAAAVMSASTVQYSRGLNFSISASRSQIRRSAGLCTRPADRPRRIFFHSSGERLKPTR